MRDGRIGQMNGIWSRLFQVVLVIIPLALVAVGSFIYRAELWRAETSKWIAIQDEKARSAINDRENLTQMVNDRFSSLRSATDDLTTAVRELTKELGVSKTDRAVLQSEVSALKSEVSALRADRKSP